MTNPARPPYRRYRCTNPACPEFRKPREVTLQHVGQGLYIVPANVICECGAEASWVWWDQ